MTNDITKALKCSELWNICISQIICTYYFSKQNKPIVCSSTIGIMCTNRQVNQPVIDAVKFDSDCYLLCMLQFLH